MSSDQSTFYVFYDLEFGPTTFNFLYTLICGELARRELSQCEGIHVVFVPGPNEGFNKHTLYPTAKKQWRFWSILLPALGLLPTIRGFTLLPNRSAAESFLAEAGPNRFPLAYSLKNSADCSQINSTNLNYALGFDMPSLQAPVLARDSVDQILGPLRNNKEIVTLTLRQSQHVPERNSDLKTWAEISKYLLDCGYYVVLLPDYEQVITGQTPEIPNVFVAKECVLNLHLRMALYEQAALNIIENGGPITLCMFNERCNYIVRRAIVPDAAGSSEKMTVQLGLAVDKDTSYFDTFARWTWHECSADKVVMICNEFRDKFGNSEVMRSDQPMTALDVFESLSTGLGSDVVNEIATNFVDGRNGPVFINRERTKDSERETVIRTAYGKKFSGLV